MENDDFYDKQIQDKLDKYKDYVEIEVKENFLKALKDYTIFFEVIYNLLIKRSLLREDFYFQSEDEFIGISVNLLKQPDKDTYETRSKDFFSVEFAKMKYYLEYAFEKYGTKSEKINLKELKGIISLLDYIDWENLNHNRDAFSNVFVAFSIDKIKNSDKLGNSIIQNAIRQCITNKREIVRNLLKIIIYEQEKYKQFIKREYLEKGKTYSSIESFTKDMRIKIVGNDRKRLANYIEEPLKSLYYENYGSDTENSKKEAFKLLDSIYFEKLMKAADQEATLKKILINGFKNLSEVSILLKKILVTYRYNDGLVHQKKNLAIKLGIEYNKETQSFSYPLKDLDGKRIIVNFKEFILALEKADRIFSELFSSKIEKLKSYTSQKLFLLLSKYKEHLKKIVESLNLFDEFFIHLRIQDYAFLTIDSVKLETVNIKEYISNIEDKLTEYRLKAK